MRKVYLETSIISYLTAKPSRTIVGAAHQQLTRLWWETRSEYDIVVSQSVWKECAAGDAAAAQRRLDCLNGIPILAITIEMVELAQALVAESIVPKKALEDALHISIATLHGIDFLLTWNCRHIANLVIQEKIAAYLEQCGLFLPIICTPEVLLGGTENE